MKTYSKRIIFNKKAVQPLLSSKCGEYCIFFSAMRSRDVAFKDIINYMQNDKTVIDFVNDL